MATIALVPFTAFPHIVLLSDGRILELCCPICNGNTRASSPYYYFNGARAVVGHINRIHKSSTIKTTKDLLASTALRVLTDAEYDSIDRREHTGIIVKRAAAKVDGAPAKTKADMEEMPIPHYPNVIRTKEGTYYQLICVFCNANAQTKRGGQRFKTGITYNTAGLEFFKGASGMLGHIVNAHKSKLDGKKTTLKWVIENCGKKLSQDAVDFLEVDTDCTQLDMIKAPGKDGEVSVGQSGDVEQGQGITIVPASTVSNHYATAACSAGDNGGIGEFDCASDSDDTINDTVDVRSVGKLDTAGDFENPVDPTD